MAAADNDALTRRNVAAEPAVQFARWLREAEAGGVAEPTAMVLATATSAGAPSQRNVLLKGFDADGFRFFTNFGSRKARQLRENTAASLLFAWYELHRQVIIEGEVRRLDDDAAREYFRSRPRAAQLGAWASRQSEELASRAMLEARLAEVAARFGGREVTLPEFWGGYCLRPMRMEFWQGRVHRLHDRIVYTRRGEGWEVGRLYP